MTPRLPINADLVTRIEAAVRYCAASGANVRHGGCGAFFDRMGDFINMPQAIAVIDTKHASSTENH